MSTPSDIARYSIDHKGRVIPMDGGMWMRYTDHLAARAADAAEIDRLLAERTQVMREYDPNCDEYVHEDQLASMRAARQTIEAVQELAVSFGHDPESCLTDVPDTAWGKIDELTERVEQLTADIAAKAEAAAKAIDEAQTDRRVPGTFAYRYQSVDQLTAIITRIFEGRSE